MSVKCGNKNCESTVTLVGVRQNPDKTELVFRCAAQRPHTSALKVDDAGAVEVLTG